jgi:two-component system LytT family response regulator
MINTIIVEDSELARIELLNLIQNTPELNVVGEAKNGAEAIQLINSTNPDLILLDIHLPDMDGFEVLNQIHSIPSVIFTTAYDEYAAKSFEYNAFDYILKPIKKDRFQKAINRLVQENTSKKTLSLQDKIFIKDSENCFITTLLDVSLFETEGNYTKVFFNGKSPLLHRSMSKIEERMDITHFFRANRQQLVNINHIVEVVLWFKGKLKLRLTCGSEVEVSERQSVELKRILSV